MDLSHSRSTDVSEVEVARLVAETRPARCFLPADRHDRRARGVALGEVEDVVADSSISDEEGAVGARNQAHAERKVAARRHAQAVRLLAKPGVGDIPGGDVSRGVHGGVTLGRRVHALLVVAEDDVGCRAGDARRRSGLVQAHVPPAVGDRLEASRRVHPEALHAIVRAAVESAQLVTRGVEGHTLWELAARRNGCANSRES